MESQVRFQTALKCCVQCCGMWRAGPDPQHLACSLSPSFHTQVHPSSRGAVACSSVDTPVVWCVSCVYNHNLPFLPTPLRIVTLRSKDAGAEGIVHPWRTDWGKRPIGPAIMFRATWAWNSDVLNTQRLGVMGGATGIASSPGHLESWPFQAETHSSKPSPGPRAVLCL